MNIRGPWSEDYIISFLERSVIPVRLAVVTRAGFPLVLSLWFTPRRTTLYCATSRDAYLTKVLRHNTKIAFEVSSDAPPYKGIRGQGEAELNAGAGPSVLEELLDRYCVSRTSRLGKMLLARAQNETAIVLKPSRILSWDFTARMGQNGRS